MSLWIDFFYLFQVSERTKYDQIFDGLQPVNGLLSGDKVKPVSHPENHEKNVRGFR